MSCFFIVVYLKKIFTKLFFEWATLHAFSLYGVIQESLSNRTKEKNEFSLKIHMKREAIKSLLLKQM